MENRCPICKKAVKISPEETSEEVKLFPFCSQRCKLIDLGAWLDGQYKVISKSSDIPQDSSVDEP